jgi:hypothetical protein
LTQVKLVPCLSWQSPETARRPGVGREGQHLAGWLLLPPLWRQTGDAADYAIGAQDVRQALTRGDDDLRSAAAFWLIGALDKLEGDPAQRWRDRVGLLLAKTCPQQPSLRSPEVSQTLARLPALAGDAFLRRSTGQRRCSCR